MNWFQRHLNWSLFFAIILLPVVLSLITGAIMFAFMGPTIAAITEGGEPTMESIFSTMLPLALVGLALALGLFVWEIIAIIWYLGKKARSKGFLMLIFGPAIFSFLLQLFGTGMIGQLIGDLCALAGLIMLFLLENRSGGYDAEFIKELEADRYQDTGAYGGVDDRQYKELDYTPDKNVMDIAGHPDIKDSGVIRDTSGMGVVGGASNASEKIPVPERPVESAVSFEKPKMPILLDDAGAVISCFYHPGADAVNMCSRCRQYVCSDCNYITGTHPICRSCWEKKGTVPITPPAQKQVKPKPVKPQKQKVTEPAVAPEPMHVEAAAPAQPIIIEPVTPQEPIVTEPIKPQEPMVVDTTRSSESIFIETGKPTEPLVAETVKQPEPISTVPVEPEQPKIETTAKAVKLDADKIQWQQDFMALYGQAAPIINMVISKSPDGMPASPLDLMEGLKLRPMLERAKKLSKPKDKELREAKGDLEQVMSNCIKIADAAANFISSGGQALLGGPDFKRIIDGIEKADELKQKLTSKLADISQPQA